MTAGEAAGTERVPVFQNISVLCFAVFFMQQNDRTLSFFPRT